MPLQPLRFLHAANLFLDRQLERDGPLPDDLRPLVADATLLAFQRLIDAAVERNVDFLLLTGNAFDVRERSIRARAALCEGLDRLDQHGIRAFIVPGEADPAWAWAELRGLPSSAVLLNDLSGDPVAVLRDGRVIATLRGFQPSSRSANSPRGREPFAIGVAMLPPDEEFPPSGDVDYVALGGPGAQQTTGLEHGIAHHPGGPQALSSDDVGPHGATLIAVDDRGHVQRSFIPTAPVRWESLTATFDGHTTLAELAGRMRAAVEQIGRERGEQLRLIDWLVQGGGELYETLEHDAVPLTRLLGEPAGLRCLHRLHLVPASGIALETSRPHTLATDFFQRLDSELPISGPMLTEALAAADLPATTAVRLQSLIAQSDPELIAGQARRLGRAWFDAEPAIRRD